MFCSQPWHFKDIFIPFEGYLSAGNNNNSKTNQRKFIIVQGFPVYGTTYTYECKSIFSSLKATDCRCAKYQSLVKITECKHEKVDIHLKIYKK